MTEATRFFYLVRLHLKQEEDEFTRAQLKLCSTFEVCTKTEKSLLDTLRKEAVRAFTVNWKLCTKCKKVMLISFYKDEKTTQTFY